MADIAPTSFVVDIARHLQTEGRFVMRVEPDGWRDGQLRAVVDVASAACEAGRLVHRPVRLTTTREAEGGHAYTITAEVGRCRSTA